jgi:hypothetical protein
MVLRGLEGYSRGGFKGFVLGFKGVLIGFKYGLNRFLMVLFVVVFLVLIGF